MIIERIDDLKEIARKLDQIYCDLIILNDTDNAMKISVATGVIREMAAVEIA